MKGDIQDRLTAAYLKARTPEECQVEGCTSPTADVVELQPLDPIDHDTTIRAFCQAHVAWADERNEFAEEIHAELREARKEIGQEHIDRIKEYSNPHGRQSEEFLMGDSDARRWDDE